MVQSLKGNEEQEWIKKNSIESLPHTLESEGLFQETDDNDCLSWLFPLENEKDIIPTFTLSFYSRIITLKIYSFIHESLSHRERITMETVYSFIFQNHFFTSISVFFLRRMTTVFTGIGMFVIAMLCLF